MTEEILSSVYIKIRSALYIAYIFCGKIRITLCTEGNNPSLIISESKHDIRIVNICNRITPLSCKRSKIPKGISYLIHAVKIINMIHFNIKYNCYRGVKIKKRVHIFTGFKKEKFFTAYSESSSHALHFSSGKHRRISPCVHEYLCTH